MGSISRKIRYTRLVSKASGEGLIASARKMNKACSTFGLTCDEYYRRGFYQMSFTQLAREAKKPAGNHARKEAAIRSIMDHSGKSREEVRETLRALNSRGITKLSYFMYNRLEMYDMDEGRTEDTLRTLAALEDLKDQIRTAFHRVDAGELTYEEIQPAVDIYTENTRLLMTDTIRESMAEMLRPGRPDLADDPARMPDIALDMEVTRTLLGFNLVEYIMFDLVSKTLPQKRQFITETDRAIVLNSINDMDRADQLDNKYRTYQLLHEFYGRDVIYVESRKDYPAFAAFCENNPQFVRKLGYDSMGRGVQPITVEGDTRALFDRLLEEGPDGFLCEGLIRTHEALTRLNPDSVNTVRLITYSDGQKVTFHWPFMKVGQKGSFVDNGGAGGIFVGINAEKGYFESNGIDEKGRRYDTHPHTGIRFEGYQLPAWEDALTLGQQIADRIPGFSFIGWDLAYTEDGRWIIVEGNSITQFLGQQSTRNLGAKKSLLETVGFRGSLEC